MRNKIRKTYINRISPRKTPVKPGTKLQIIDKMLRRKAGCTARECMDRCGWPAISMHQQARAAGLKLRIEKDGGLTRYYGVPA